MSEEPPDDRTRELAPGSGAAVLRFAQLAPGAVFAERYRVVRSLGSGGSGEVFEVEDSVSRLRVALKVLYPYPGEQNLERLRRELRLVRRLEHPGILRIHDIGEAHGLLYTVSDLLTGETLRDLLAREGALPVERALGLLRKILEALAAAHEQGIVHRDIKPANVFLVGADGSGESREPGEPGEREERVVLLDFGLAREAGGSGMTTVGRFLGTPEYASPEQALGDADLTPATDVYACGITLWHMLAGAPPYVRDTDFATLLAHTRDPLPAMPRTPRHVRALLAAMLAKDPPARLRDAHAALLRLDARGAGRWLRDALLLSRPSGSVAGVQVAALGIVVIVGAAVLLGVLAWPTGIDVDGKRVVWRSRSGLFDRASEPLPVRVRNVQIEPGRWPPRALVMPQGPSHAAIREGSDATNSSTYLYEVRWPASEMRRVGEKSFTAFEGRDRVLPGHDDYLTPIEFHVLRGGRSRAIVILQQMLSYDNRFGFLLEGDGMFFPFMQTGAQRHVAQDVVTIEGTEYAIIAAINNALGPRDVLFSLPLVNANEKTQSPPYLDDPSLRDKQRGWYVPLDGGWSSLRTLEVRVAGDVVELHHGDSAPARFDARTGVPLDAQDRDGLDAETWHARLEALWDAMFQAAAESHAGRPRAAAEILEAYAGSESRVPRFAAIAFHRAAVERRAAAGGSDRAEWERALSAVRASRALEPAAARARLLEAELCARLSMKEEALRIATEWGRSAEHAMYWLEWVLVHLAAGEEVPSRLLPPDGRWGASNGWQRSVAFVHADRGGDREAALDEFEQRLAATLREYELAAKIGGSLPHFPDRIDAIWRTHADYVAHLALDLDPPDPRRALALLEKLGWLGQAGVPDIADLAALRARILLDDRTPTPDEIASAEARARDLERIGATDIVALYTARRAWLDAAWLADRAGDAERAAHARTQARRDFHDPKPTAAP